MTSEEISRMVALYELTQVVIDRDRYGMGLPQDWAKQVSGNGTGDVVWWNLTALLRGFEGEGAPLLGELIKTQLEISELSPPDYFSSDSPLYQENPQLSPWEIDARELSGRAFQRRLEILSELYASVPHREGGVEVVRMRECRIDERDLHMRGPNNIGRFIEKRLSEHGFDTGKLESVIVEHDIDHRQHIYRQSIKERLGRTSRLISDAFRKALLGSLDKEWRFYAIQLPFQGDHSGICAAWDSVRSRFFQEINQETHLDLERMITAGRIREERVVLEGKVAVRARVYDMLVGRSVVGVTYSPDPERTLGEEYSKQFPEVVVLKDHRYEPPEPLSPPPNYFENVRTALYSENTSDSSSTMSFSTTATTASFDQNAWRVRRV